jgi:hypothetical protein
MDKNRLIQQIDNLKNDIQNLINTKKELVDKDKIKICNEDKKIKMSNLKKLTDELNAILKKERIEIQNKNELRNITKSIDNLEYQASKKMGKSVAIDNVNKIKEMREITKSKYLEYLEIEKKYMEYDPKKVPGYLFLHSKILKEYGLCPYMEINISNSTSENINDHIKKLENSRLEWLNSQNDKGLLYFNLYNDINEKLTLKTLDKNKKDIEKSIDIFIRENLSDSQYEIYNDCIKFIKEWINCRIKTKRIKDKYKTFINNLSILFNETLFEFHTLLSIKYNIQININHFDNLNKNVNKSKDDRLQKILLVEKFNEYIKEYTTKLELMNTNERYVKNITNQLKCDLCLFLTDKKSFNIKMPLYNINKQKNKITQSGKYFKKWSLLSQDEQLERFESFSKYYVQNINIYEKDELELSDKLFDLLNDLYISKQLSYRDFKWNIKMGYIEKITKLKYDKENGFVLDLVKSNKEKTDTENNDTISNNNSNIDNSKKKVSYKTIINMDTERIINEEILYFILKKNIKQINNIDLYNKYKNDILEIIKIKLKIKKISVDDKQKIYKIYDDIYKIIETNKNSKIE